MSTTEICGLRRDWGKTSNLGYIMSADIDFRIPVVTVIYVLGGNYLEAKCSQGVVKGEVEHVSVSQLRLFHCQPDAMPQHPVIPIPPVSALTKAGRAVNYSSKISISLLAP